jgi:hypothetical protein
VVPSRFFRVSVTIFEVGVVAVAVVVAVETVVVVLVG